MVKRAVRGTRRKESGAGKVGLKMATRCTDSAFPNSQVMLRSNVNINRHSTQRAFPSVNTRPRSPQIAEFSIERRRDERTPR